MSADRRPENDIEKFRQNCTRLQADVVSSAFPCVSILSLARTARGAPWSPNHGGELLEERFLESCKDCAVGENSVMPLAAFPLQTLIKFHICPSEGALRPWLRCRRSSHAGWSMRESPPWVFASPGALGTFGEELGVSLVIHRLFSFPVVWGGLCSCDFTGGMDLLGWRGSAWSLVPWQRTGPSIKPSL